MFPSDNSPLVLILTSLSLTSRFISYIPWTQKVFMNRNNNTFSYFYFNCIKFCVFFFYVYTNNTVDLDMLTGWTERFWTVCRSPTTSITNHSTSLAETYPCLLQHSRLSTDSENWQHSTITLPSSYRTQSSLFYLKMWIGLNLMHLVRLKCGKQSDGLIFSTRVPQLLGELWSLAFLLLHFDMLPNTSR